VADTLTTGTAPTPASELGTGPPPLFWRTHPRRRYRGAGTQKPRRTRPHQEIRAWAAGSVLSIRGLTPSPYSS